jgi:copper chaperone
LSSIIFCSIGAGLILDFLIIPSKIEISDYRVDHLIGPWVKVFCSILFTGVIINSLRIKYFSKSRKSNKLLNIIYIDGMTCSHCVDSVKKSLSKLKNIDQIDIELSSGKIEYRGNKESIQVVQDTISSLGYKIKS